MGLACRTLFILRPRPCLILHPLHQMIINLRPMKAPILRAPFSRPATVLLRMEEEKTLNFARWSFQYESHCHMKAHSSSIVIARLILQALPPENSLKFGSIRSYFMMTVESFCQGLMAYGNKPNFVPLIQNTIDRKFYTVKLMYELCNLSYIIHDYVRLICGSIFSGEKTMKKHLNFCVHLIMCQDLVFYASQY